jgi:L-alanine-DL-glutamate epimerase-like enolase superfamily enzyme
MQIAWKKYRLPLEGFTISKGTFYHRDCLIIKLTQGNLSGLGELTAISYYDIAIDPLIEIIEKNLQRLSALRLVDPTEHFQRVKSILGNHPFLLSAFDCAAYDLYAKLKQSATRDLIPLENPRASLPQTSFTIGLGSCDRVIEDIIKTPWPIYKIKLGGEQDLQIMQEIKRNTSAILRVDANEGWTNTNCLAYAQRLQEMDVEFIEQPLPRSHEKGMAYLKKNVDIPLIADESCQTFDDVERCQEGFDGINIKLMKCGGITPAIQMIKKAKELNLKIMLGCMTESSIGISAAAQLIPWVDYVDLDGAMLIKEDIATGITFENGTVQYDPGLGHGCQLTEIW